MDSFERIALSGGMEKSKTVEYFGGTSWCFSLETLKGS